MEVSLYSTVCTLPAFSFAFFSRSKCVCLTTGVARRRRICNSVTVNLNCFHSFSFSFFRANLSGSRILEMGNKTVSVCGSWKSTPTDGAVERAGGAVGGNNPRSFLT
jgi:hypothetical protein